MTFTLEYDSADLARLQRALDKLGVEHLAKPMYSEIGKDIADKAGLYPQWTDSPPPYPYWVRGRGWQYASGKNSGTSQDMRNQWKTIIGTNDLIIRNTATYAWDVIGPGQKPVHKQHGWKLLFEEAVKALPGIIKKLEARALKLWEETR